MDHLEEIVDLAKKFIAIPSVSTDTEKVIYILELAKEKLNQYTFIPFVSNKCPSLFYTNQLQTTKKCKIILNAHLDVVPATEFDYLPREKNGKLYGRGAYDMKAAAAVMILLFRDIAQSLSYPLGLQLTTDEETNGFEGTRYQIQNGVGADFVITGESNSNFKITNQAKGRMGVKIMIRGNTAHAAHPWQGKNAVWEMYSLLETLMQAFPTPKEETYETTVTITKINSENTAINKIPDTCIAYLDVRYKPQEHDTILTKIKTLLPETVSIEFDSMSSPHFADPQTPLIKLLQNITTKKLGQGLPLRFAHATSDARFFSEIGCAAIEFGPIGKNPHADNEWVAIESLGYYYEILKEFLISAQ